MDNTEPVSTSAPIAGESVTAVTPTPAAALEIMSEEKDQLAIVVSENALSAERGKSLEAGFGPIFAEAKKIISESRAIVVTDASQRLQIKISRDYRLALRQVRIAGDKKHRALKEESLRYGKAVDGFRNILLHLVETEENRLQDQEDFVELQEQKRKDSLKAARAERLTALGVNPDLYLLGDLSDEDWGRLLAMHEQAAADKAKKERDAEADRIRKEEADRAEQARIKAENERLQQEAKEAQEKAAAIEEKARKEKEAADAALAAERAETAKREADAAATAKAERDAIEAKAKADLAALEAKAKEDNDALAARLAAEQVEKDRIAAEKRRQESVKAKAEQDRKAKVREERHKQLLAFPHSRYPHFDIAEIPEKDWDEQIASSKRSHEAEVKRLADAKAEKESAARELAEATALKKQMEAEVEADKERARAAAAAPDREKLLAFAGVVRALVVPEMKTPDGMSAALDVKQKAIGFADWIERKIADAMPDPAVAPPAKAKAPKQATLL